MDKHVADLSVARLAKAIWNQYGDTIMREWEEERKRGESVDESSQE